MARRGRVWVYAAGLPRKGSSAATGGEAAYLAAAAAAAAAAGMENLLWCSSLVAGTSLK